jgi:hypothetical protein
MLGRASYCRSLYNPENRVRLDATHLSEKAPRCACEQFRVSSYSPSPVLDEEQLARFVFEPVDGKRDFLDKNGKLKGNSFSQIFTNGCSIQRELASDKELYSFVRAFSLKNNKKWVAVAVGTCSDVRQVVHGDPPARAVCVFDTGAKDNTSHSEIFQSYAIPEADRLELKRKVLKAFLDGNVIYAAQYRAGRIAQLQAAAL